MWTRVTRSMLCVPALLLAGAGYAAGQSATVTSSQSLPGRVVEVKAAEFNFQAPDTISAGLTTFRLLQAGFVVDRMRAGVTGRALVADPGDNTRGVHMLWVVRLDSGKTIRDLYDAAVARQRTTSWARQLGGPAFAFPPSTTNATMDLEPGNYALVCYIGSAHEDRTRYHVMHGMFRALTVVPSSQPSAAPTVDVVATISPEKKVTFSKPLRPGRVTIRVENEYDKELEFKFQRVPDGLTGKEFLAQPPGSGQATPAGGLAGVPGRGSIITTVDFTAGEYVVGTHMSMKHFTSQAVTVPARSPE